MAFKSRRMKMDAARSKSRPRQVRLKNTRSRSSKVRVKSGSTTARKKRPVPKEYRTFDRAPRYGWGFIFFLFLLFATTVAGFWYWSQRPPVITDQSVTLLATGTDRLVSGDEATFTIRVPRTTNTFE